jgi:hypothetical protein
VLPGYPLEAFVFCDRRYLDWPADRCWTKTKMSELHGRIDKKVCEVDRRSLMPPEKADPVALGKSTYTIEEVALRGITANAIPEKIARHGYSVRILVPLFEEIFRFTLPEAWEIRILENSSEGPIKIYEDNHFGPRWSGESEALDRLILGFGSKNGRCASRTWRRSRAS